MSRLVRAELLKIRTTRTVYWLLALMLALVALVTAVSTWRLTQEGGPFSPGTSEGLRSVLGGIGTSGGHLILLCLGILALGGEFRHNTITPTVLATPRRWRVVAAKLAAITLVSLVFAVLAIGLALAIALPWLAVEDVSVSLGQRELQLTLLGNLLVLVLFGAIGLGVGALVRNQVVAVTVAILYVFILEPLLMLLTILVEALQPVARFLPLSAANALQRAVVPPEGPGVGLALLPMWAGGLVLAAYALVFCALGARFVVSRDIT